MTIPEGNRFQAIHLLAARVRLERHVMTCGLCLQSPAACILRRQFEAQIAAREEELPK